MRHSETSEGPGSAALAFDPRGTLAAQGECVRWLRYLSIPLLLLASCVVSPQPSPLTNFTTDDAALRDALSQIVERGRVPQDGQQLAESFRCPPPRRVLVVEFNLAHDRSVVPLCIRR